MNEPGFYLITTYGLMRFELTDNLPDIQDWLLRNDINYWPVVRFDAVDLCKEYLEACYSLLPTYNPEGGRL